MKTLEGIRIARRFKRALLDAKLPVAEVHLFGSIAKGTARPDSDIDIAVVVSGDAACGPAKPRLWRIAHAIDMRIEPICMNRERLNDKYSTLAQEIRTFGIPIR
ncbi:MAG: nucleotidyltransferase domain-containing protein [Patescibacteria group bacterium]